MRRVAVFTGTRADFGLLRPLAMLAQADPRVELLLIVSGSHLSATHGSTIEEIRATGLPIASEVPIWSGDETAVGAAADVGASVGDYAVALESLHPDIVVVLGDRLEALALALAATILQIPVAHIHGGELTEGAMDDSLRHAITKLSLLHFATTESHRDRILQLGEEPHRVFNVGAPVLDALAELRLESREELERRFPVTFGENTVLVTFHPAAFDAVESPELLRRLLAALDARDDIRTIITGTNTDIGSEALRAEIEAYVGRTSDRTDYVESFGQLGYLSAIAQSRAIVGNSSSTVLEAPLLGIPSVVLGDRQRGRPLSAGVLTPEPTTAAIAAALETALSTEFRERAAAAPSVFGTPGFAARTLDVLATYPLPTPPRKQFSDLGAS